jgi:hypothetical protein
MKLSYALLLASCILAAPALADTTWVVCGVPDAVNTVPFCGLSTDAMRFQILYLQNELNTAGEIVAFGLAASDNPAARFDNVRVTLCHTSRSSLDTVFATNYDGNTPQLVFQADTLRVGAQDTWYYFPCSFAYNNTDNLIFELQWRGDEGLNVNFYRSVNGAEPRRAWNVGNDTAATGQNDLVQAYYARIGFLPGGLAETGNIRTAEPALEVRPSVGRDFAVRCPAAVGARAGLEVLDVSGRTVARLSATADGAGCGAVWHADHAPAGVYIVRAAAAGRTWQRQITVTE